MIVCGEDVRRKKPDPEAYAIALEKLGLAPDDALAFEDTRNGLIAARAAGLRVVLTPSSYSEGEDFDGAAMLASDLDHGPEGDPVTLQALAALLR